MKCLKLNYDFSYEMLASRWCTFAYKDICGLLAVIEKVILIYDRVSDQKWDHKIEICLLLHFEIYSQGFCF